MIEMDQAIRGLDAMESAGFIGYSSGLDDVDRGVVAFHSDLPVPTPGYGGSLAVYGLRYDRVAITKFWEGRDRTGRLWPYTHTLVLAHEDYERLHCNPFVLLHMGIFRPPGERMARKLDPLRIKPPEDYRDPWSKTGDEALADAECPLFENLVAALLEKRRIYVKVPTGLSFEARNALLEKAILSLPTSERLNCSFTTVLNHPGEKNIDLLQPVLAELLADDLDCCRVNLCLLADELAVPPETFTPGIVHGLTPSGQPSGAFSYQPYAKTVVETIRRDRTPQAVVAYYDGKGRNEHLNLLGKFNTRLAAALADETPLADFSAHISWLAGIPWPDGACPERLMERVRTHAHMCATVEQLQAIFGVFKPLAEAREEPLKKSSMALLPIIARQRVSTSATLAELVFFADAKHIRCDYFKEALDDPRIRNHVLERLVDDELDPRASHVLVPLCAAMADCDRGEGELLAMALERFVQTTSRQVNAFILPHVLAWCAQDEPLRASFFAGDFWIGMFCVCLKDASCGGRHARDVARNLLDGIWQRQACPPDDVLRQLVATAKNDARAQDAFAQWFPSRFETLCQPSAKNGGDDSIKLFFSLLQALGTIDLQQRVLRQTPHPKKSNHPEMACAICFHAARLATRGNIKSAADFLWRAVATDYLTHAGFEKTREVLQGEGLSPVACKQLFCETIGHAIRSQIAPSRMRDVLEFFHDLSISCWQNCHEFTQCLKTCLQAKTGASPELKEALVLMANDDGRYDLAEVGRKLLREIGYGEKASPAAPAAAARAQAMRNKPSGPSHFGTGDGSCAKTVKRARSKPRGGRILAIFAMLVIIDLLLVGLIWLAEFSPIQHPTVVIAADNTLTVEFPWWIRRVEVAISLDDGGDIGNDASVDAKIVSKSELEAVLRRYRGVDAGIKLEWKRLRTFFKWEKATLSPQTFYPSPSGGWQDEKVDEPE